MNKTITDIRQQSWLKMLIISDSSIYPKTTPPPGFVQQPFLGFVGKIVYDFDSLATGIKGGYSLMELNGSYINYSKYEQNNFRFGNMGSGEKIAWLT